MTSPPLTQHCNFARQLTHAHNFSRHTRTHTPHHTITHTHILRAEQVPPPDTQGDLARHHQQLGLQSTQLPPWMQSSTQKTSQFPAVQPSHFSSGSDAGFNAAGNGAPQDGYPLSPSYYHQVCNLNAGHNDVWTFSIDGALRKWFLYWLVEQVCTCMFTFNMITSEE